MKRCLFIINPSSGQRTIQNTLDKLIGQLTLRQLINHIDVFYTLKKDDAYFKALNADEQDYDFITVVGGDGTINEVVSGMVASDKGKINERYFMNVAAGGMFSDVSFTVSKADKKRLGPLAYYLNGIANLPSQLNTNINLKIVLDDANILETEAKMFMVTNTNRVGGFENIIPYADIQDGMLDLIVIKKCSVTDLVALSKDYLLKKHANSPFISYVQAKKIEIYSQQKVVIDIDGEEGSPLPVTIEAISQAINILVP